MKLHPLLAPLAWLLGGCPPQDAPQGDTGFFVAAVVPEDGDMDVVPSVHPELRVSSSASEQTCTTDSVRFGILGDDGAISWTLPYSLSFPDNGSKIKIEPDGGLLSGYWYAIAVRSGSWGCTDTEGRMIRPFASRFFVPP